MLLVLVYYMQCKLLYLVIKQGNDCVQFVSDMSLTLSLAFNAHLGDEWVNDPP